MVKAKRKPLEEIIAMLGENMRVLTVGCGGCTSVCLAGGQKEVLDLNQELASYFKRSGKEIKLVHYTVERQCNSEYLSDVEDLVEPCDCLLSLACGAGVQLLAETYQTKPVFPALNTLFVGIDRNVGLFEERCSTCGDCKLGYTGGICPVTRCSKSIFNGPCGGTKEDLSCEVSDDIPCAWHEIYERLKRQGRMEHMLAIHPPMNWNDKGAETFAQLGYESRYRKFGA